MEQSKKSSIDLVKLHESIMNDPIIKELNKRKEECLKVAIPVMLKFDNEFKMSIQYESINEVYLRNIDRMINDRYEYCKELYKDL